MSYLGLKCLLATESPTSLVERHHQVEAGNKPALFRNADAEIACIGAQAPAMGPLSHVDLLRAPCYRKGISGGWGALDICSDILAMPSVRTPNMSALFLCGRTTRSPTESGSNKAKLTTCLLLQCRRRYFSRFRSRRGSRRATHAGCGTAPNANSFPAVRAGCPQTGHSANPRLVYSTV